MKIKTSCPSNVEACNFGIIKAKCNGPKCLPIIQSKHKPYIFAVRDSGCMP